MTAISTLEALRTLQEGKIKILTATTAARFFRINNRNTVYKLLQRLTDNKVLLRGTGGKYFVSGASFNSFYYANNLVSPSYVSLESALNLYGILSQFPYVVTSVTLKRNNEVSFDNREFFYSSISPSLYFGFIKTDDFLIATPEKAYLDYLYYCRKKSVKVDTQEWDFSIINKKLLREMAKSFSVELL